MLLPIFDLKKNIEEHNSKNTKQLSYSKTARITFFKILENANSLINSTNKNKPEPDGLISPYHKSNLRWQNRLLAKKNYYLENIAATYAKEKNLQAMVTINDKLRYLEELIALKKLLDSEENWKTWQNKAPKMPQKNLKQLWTNQSVFACYSNEEILAIMEALTALQQHHEWASQQLSKRWMRWEIPNEIRSLYANYLLDFKHKAHFLQQQLSYSAMARLVVWENKQATIFTPLITGLQQYQIKIQHPTLIPDTMNVEKFLNYYAYIQKYGDEATKIQSSLLDFWRNNDLALQIIERKQKLFFVPKAIVHAIPLQESLFAQGANLRYHFFQNKTVSKLLFAIASLEHATINAAEIDFVHPTQDSHWLLLEGLNTKTAVLLKKIQKNIYRGIFRGMYKKTNQFFEELGLMFYQQQLLILQKQIHFVEIILEQQKLSKKSSEDLSGMLANIQNVLTGKAAMQEPLAIRDKKNELQQKLQAIAQAYMQIKENEIKRAIEEQGRQAALNAIACIVNKEEEEKYSTTFIDYFKALDEQRQQEFITENKDKIQLIHSQLCEQLTNYLSQIMNQDLPDALFWTKITHKVMLLRYLELPQQIMQCITEVLQEYEEYIEHTPQEILLEKKEVLENYELFLQKVFYEAVSPIALLQNKRKQKFEIDIAETALRQDVNFYLHMARQTIAASYQYVDSNPIQQLEHNARTPNFVKKRSFKTSLSSMSFNYKEMTSMLEKDVLPMIDEKTAQEYIRHN